MTLTEEQRKDLASIILFDSMEYALLDYGEEEFKDLIGNDPELLALRKQYIEAANKIADLAGISEEDWGRGKI
jgi:hypothetical protein